MRSALGLVLCLSLSLLRTQAADVYRLDAINTRISFNIQHFGVLWLSARFPDFSGDFVLDRRGSASRVDVSVQMASVDCNDSHWNGRLRSADWLDVQRYPQMSFHSNRVEFDGNNRAVASGDLTLHGVTRAVGLEISQLSCPDAAGSGASCRFVAHARIKRSDYGFPHGFWTGGDQVDIAISGVGVRGASSACSAADGAIPGDASATHAATSAARLSARVSFALRVALRFKASRPALQADRRTDASPAVDAGAKVAANGEFRPLRSRTQTAAPAEDCAARSRDAHR